MRRVSQSRHDWRPKRGSGQLRAAKQPPLTTDPSPATPYGLSESELSVLQLLTEGLQDRQIALRLGVTVYTVNKHVGAILVKMDVRSRTAAAVRALREHIFALVLLGVL